MDFVRFLAATITPGAIGYDSPITNASTFLARALGVTYSIAGIVAVIVIIIGGFMYITSAGNTDRIKTAKNAILYSVIGLVVVITAFIITRYVIGVF
jgi:TRAP-type C4-dicarboxylate transport system permease small subunit